MSRGKDASTGHFLSEPNRILSQSIKGKSETNPKLYSKHHFVLKSTFSSPRSFTIAFFIAIECHGLLELVEDADDQDMRHADYITQRRREFGSTAENTK